MKQIMYTDWAIVIMQLNISSLQRNEPMNDFTVKGRNEAHSGFIENLVRNIIFYVLKPLRWAQARVNGSFN